ncbi:MAG: phosphomannomutase/phosphoglucomutase [Candidatus Nitronauta litoralis]|uniref:Phosphomannomutase/phosphoglucomutase n=1 Tax=Candidatus Nitronauta litoralis TaxID=2705533 RepID=A0A7T0BWY3_9BACT|nr:MAG: phosphomannomutase/phosphoglucomutase [Candidatus Nitronauta litoralis]
MKHKVNPAIFRESDIRGVVDVDLTPESVEWIGRAVGTYLCRNNGKTITLAWDVRPSSVRYRDIVTRALLSSGCDILEMGLAPSPVSYFAQHHFKSDGGIMITASHNPATFNGFKVSINRECLVGDEIQSLRQLVEKQDFDSGQGSLKKIDAIQPYRKFLQESLKFPRPIKVVVDGGNGCFGVVGPSVLRNLGVDLVELHTQPDGTFPNHHPDPTLPENLKDLVEKVRQEGAEVGIGFDGDMDRIGVVDEKGKIIWGDQLMILFARDLLKRFPGAKILGEVKCSQSLFKQIEEYGGIPEMTAVGHSLIKKTMKSTGALLAGEMSGHIFFADEFFGFDDALYAACRLLRILGDSPIPLSQMLADIPETSTTPEIRRDCPDELKFEVVENMRKYLEERYEIVNIDGVRINFEDGWALVRASNTQPALTLRFEAKTPHRLKEIQEIIEKPLMQFCPSI